MKDSFTLNDLILYSSIGSESEEEMQTIQVNKRGENPAGPDRRVIQNIMNYSRALSVIKTNQAGPVKLLLN